MSDTLVTINNLTKHFPIRSGFLSRPVAWVKAVDGINLTIQRGETLGLVGESGCGKTTLVNTLLHLIDPTSGKVLLEDVDLFALNKAELRKIRKDIQIVFQDPFWSLNPRMLIRDVVGEPLKVHLKLNRDEIVTRVEELLELVGLPKEGVFKYPHEFSGGQRQRIAIARALALQPKIVILDEPTSSIDIMSQEQILALLQDLKDRFQLTYILISHDLSVVHSMSDRIAVMYLGKIVELGAADEIFNTPQHPYTQALFNAIPDLSMDSIDEVASLEGNVPSAINPPEGCRFHTRCPKAMDICSQKEPESISVGTDHISSCHLLCKH